MSVFLCYIYLPTNHVLFIYVVCHYTDCLIEMNEDGPKYQKLLMYSHICPRTAANSYCQY